jgi:hypothetical protein
MDILESTPPDQRLALFRKVVFDLTYGQWFSETRKPIVDAKRRQRLISELISGMLQENGK